MALAPLLVTACGGSSDVGIGPSTDAGDASDSKDAAVGTEDANVASEDAGDATLPTGDAGDRRDASGGGEDAGDASSSSVDASVDANDAGSSQDASDAASAVDATLPDAGPPVLCVPGESIECAGPGGCISNQVCVADGSGYGPCGCASDASEVLACVPGQSIACAGVGGCSGYQVCNGVGSGYEPCQCEDAGSGNRGGDGGGVTGWTPAELPGLVLWLDDDYGLIADPAHPGYLVHWLDKSGHGNNANLPGEPGSSGQWDGAEIDPDGVNLHDAIICGDLSATVPASEDFDWSTSDFAIVAVYEGAPSDLWNGNNVVLGTTSNEAGLHLSVGTQDVTLGLSNVSPFWLVAARGPSLYLQTGTSSVATGPSTAPGASPGPVDLCALNAFAPDAEMAEVIAIKGTLSDADLANVTTYLTTKFALH